MGNILNAPLFLRYQIGSLKRFQQGAVRILAKEICTAIAKITHPG